MKKRTNKERRRLVRVAVSGHRPNQIPASAAARIRGDIDTVFDTLERVGARASERPLRYVLRTSLAEGADRFVTAAAIARAWGIEAVLPFEGDRYLEDFADAASIVEYKSMLAQARPVLTVEGERLEREQHGAAPYAAAGRVLVERCDLLVCIWNGLPPKGPGGTSEVAALMLERGGLVLWIAVEDARVRLVSPAPLPRAGSFRRNLHEALAKQFERIARPAEMRVA